MTPLPGPKRPSALAAVYGLLVDLSGCKHTQQHGMKTGQHWQAS